MCPSEFISRFPIIKCIVSSKGDRQLRNMKNKQASKQANKYMHPCIQKNVFKKEVVKSKRGGRNNAPNLFLHVIFFSVVLLLLHF